MLRLYTPCKIKGFLSSRHADSSHLSAKDAALSAALRDKAAVEERLAKEMAAWQVGKKIFASAINHPMQDPMHYFDVFCCWLLHQATLASMQQGRNDEAWKGRMQRMRAELEAAKAERDGLMQGMQVAGTPGRGAQLQQQPLAVQYAQLPQQMNAQSGPPAYGQQQSLGQGRAAGPIRGPMPALRTFGAK